MATDAKGGKIMMFGGSMDGGLTSGGSAKQKTAAAKNPWLKFLAKNKSKRNAGESYAKFAHRMSLLYKK
jgi:hypothetical protein